MNAKKVSALLGLVLAAPAALFEGSMLLQYQLGRPNAVAKSFETLLAHTATGFLTNLSIVLGPALAVGLNAPRIWSLLRRIRGRAPAGVPDSGHWIWNAAAAALGAACLGILGIYLVCENLRF